MVVLQSRLFLGMTHDIPSKNERQRCMRFFPDPRQLYIPSEYSQSITSQAYSSMSNPQQLYLIGERLVRDYAFAGSGAKWVPSIIIVGSCNTRHRARRLLSSQSIDWHRCNNQLLDKYRSLASLQVEEVLLATYQ